MGNMDMNMTRRGFVTAVAGAFGMALMAGCSGAKEQETSTETQTADYTIEYGTSELYTQKDMDAAIAVILAEFDTWKGCTMKSIAFTDDKTCTDNVEYVNSLRADGDAEFDQAIVFSTDFHSPSEEDAKGTAWEPDTDYNGYTWYLGRTGADGTWKLLTWGYA